jgi:hypothetical protein
MNKNRLWIVLAALAAAALACNAVMGGGKTPTPAAGDSDIVEATATGDGDTQNPESEYPLPDSVSNFNDLGQGTVNFQTTLSLQEVMDFYRDSFGKEGYTERELLTVESESTFSFVFDGHASGKAIVVQGVDLGGGSTNVSIRLEAVD